jgi:hypothetical protein
MFVPDYVAAGVRPVQRPKGWFVLVCASAELLTNSRASIAQSRRLITSSLALLDDSRRLLATIQGLSGMAARDGNTARIAHQYRDLSGMSVDDPRTMTTRIVQALGKAGVTCEVHNLPTLH